MYQPHNNTYEEIQEIHKSISSMTEHKLQTMYLARAISSFQYQIIQLTGWQTIKII